ncbi:hypothetical protein [Micromonospora sp. NPDC047740]|uniref:hypothetical protein n=1 Tax=Micromonospora sp. NPDC047740 TaxID=3364254 RepID=UPI0037162B41
MNWRSPRPAVIAAGLGAAFVLSATVSLAVPILNRSSDGGSTAAESAAAPRFITCFQPPQPTGVVPDPCWDLAVAAGRSTPSHTAREAARLAAVELRTELSAVKDRQPPVCMTTAAGGPGPCRRANIDTGELRTALNRVGLVDHVVRPARSNEITEGKGLVFAARVEGACVLGYVLPSGEAAGVAGTLPDGTCLSV